MDLPGWVPQSGGAHKTGDAMLYPAEKVTIEGVSHVLPGCVSFTCSFQGKSIGYDFWILDKKLAEKVAKVLNDNRGKTLLSIGWVEISEDE
jgi:hypothetical protein